MQCSLLCLAGVGNGGYGLTLSNLKQYIFVSISEREVIMYFASEGTVLTIQHPKNISVFYSTNLLYLKIIQKISLNLADVPYFGNTFKQVDRILHILKDAELCQFLTTSVECGGTQNITSNPNSYGLRYFLGVHWLTILRFQLSLFKEIVAGFLHSIVIHSNMV